MYLMKIVLINLILCFTLPASVMFSSVVNCISCNADVYE